MARSTKRLVGDVGDVTVDNTSGLGSSINIDVKVTLDLINPLLIICPERFSPWMRSFESGCSSAFPSALPSAFLTPLVNSSILISVRAMANDR